MLGLCFCVLCQYFCACVLQACNGYSATLQVLSTATMRVDVAVSWIVSQSARTTRRNSKNKALRKQVWDTYTSCQLPCKWLYPFVILTAIWQEKEGVEEGYGAKTVVTDWLPVHDGQIEYYVPSERHVNLCCRMTSSSSNIDTDSYPLCECFHYSFVHIQFHKS